MTRKSLLFYALSAVVAGSVFWACRKDLRSETGMQDDALTVEQARAFFENTVAPTKTSGYLSSGRSAGGDLNPGEMTPLWNRSHSATLNYYVDGVDVEIDADYRYCAVFNEVTAEGDTVRHTVELVQKLVVNRWRNHPRWLGLYAYIATIIPAPQYYARHKDFGRRFVNLGDKGDFSGFVIYHTLSGEFVNADRYDGGKDDGAGVRHGRRGCRPVRGGEDARQRGAVRERTVDVRVGSGSAGSNRANVQGLRNHVLLLQRQSRERRQMSVQ